MKMVRCNLYPKSKIRIRSRNRIRKWSISNWSRSWSWNKNCSLSCNLIRIGGNWGNNLINSRIRK